MKAKMKVSEVLAEYDSHGAYDADAVEKKFKDKAGLDIHIPGTLAKELRPTVMTHPKGLLRLDAKDETRIVPGWTIASTVAHKLIPKYYSPSLGRGSMFWDYVTAIKKAGK